MADIATYQMNMNAYLINELKKVKEEHRRLDDDILQLKMQNLSLQSKLEKLSTPGVNMMNGAIPSHPTGTLSISPPIGAENFIDSRKAMVVYDLTKNPPIVLTTNDTFCKMIGYDMVRKKKKKISCFQQQTTTKKY